MGRGQGARFIDPKAPHERRLTLVRSLLEQYGWTVARPGPTVAHGPRVRAGWAARLLALWSARASSVDELGLSI